MTLKDDIKIKGFAVFKIRLGGELKQVTDVVEDYDKAVTDLLRYRGLHTSYVLMAIIDE